MDEKTGAQIFVEALKREGVEIIFGYPGAAVIYIYDELFDSDIKTILPHHEQGGVHAADGYARSTGKVGVCMATSGPGATNLVTGLATAYMDSVGIVAFTGQVPTSMIGTDGFQEIDIKGISTPITKHNYLVEDVRELPRIIKEAFHLAGTGRPGPVLVDIPKNVQQDTTNFYYPETVDIQGYNPVYESNDLQVKEAAEFINNSKRPLIYAGGGVNIAEASEELTKLAHKASIPVTTTLTAIGCFDEYDELSLGMPGMHGTSQANLAFTKTDLVIALGARFDDRVTGNVESFAPGANIIHVDIDSAELDKIIETDIAIEGDVKSFLESLNPLIDENAHEQWLKQIEEWKLIDDYKAMKDDAVSPRIILEELDNLTDGNVLLTTEVGQHQMWAAKFFNFSRPRSLITSGGLGTMGYGFPAALGVKAGNPDKEVVCIAGDGSMQMNIQELATAAKNNLSVTILIFNNQYLGMVRQWQELFLDSRYASTCLRKRDECPRNCKGPESEAALKECPEFIPDFIQVARGYGIRGEKVINKEGIRPALKKALATEGPYIVDFRIEREENVFPMVPAGGSLDEMILSDEDEFKLL
ncbi:MAG: biosynthetic-type acetolactate synthase large subunit [Halanaerobiales bacterium]